MTDPIKVLVVMIPATLLISAMRNCANLSKRLPYIQTWASNARQLDHHSYRLPARLTTAVVAVKTGEEAQPTL